MESKKQMPMPSIGGQAVMEGVMMKSPTAIAVAVRKTDGSIARDVKKEGTKARKGTFFGLPFVRGVVAFVESLVVGMGTITRSAEMAGIDLEEEPTRFEKWLSKTLGKSLDKVVIGLAVVFAIALSVLLFFLLPTFISGLVLPDNVASIWKSLLEGVVRLLIFFGYIIGIGQMKDIARLFQYHGAEHKTLACFEAGRELTPENAMECSRFHARCGTNYLFLVMGISILFFAMIGFSDNLWIRMGTRIIFLPVVAGISYEVLRFGAKSESLVARIVRAPGMALQHITTKEPDESMLEIAITAFNMAMDPDKALSDIAEEAAAKKAEEEAALKKVEEEAAQASESDEDEKEKTPNEENEVEADEEKAVEETTEEKATEEKATEADISTQETETEEGITLEEEAV